MTPTRHVTHRSDPQIFAAARVALDQNPAVPASVRVHVDDGIITLTGSVRTSAERTTAEETIRGVDGVRRIVNDIFVLNVPVPQGFEPPDYSD